MNHLHDAEFWSQRYREGQTGWDLGQVAPPLKAYFDQLRDKTLRILIPGAGNAYEAEYLFQQGFKSVYLLDIARPPLENFRQRNPDFPVDQILQGDFFDHQDTYDLIVEQTFFCAFEPSPELRQTYGHKIKSLLSPGGKLMGLWWTFPLREQQDSPPYGGTLEEYLLYFKKADLHVRYFEPCYNSANGRMGKEYFGLLEKVV